MSQTNQAVIHMKDDEPRAVVSTPMEMINRAMELGNIDMVERLMAMHERFEANLARKAFDKAMAAAKAEIPTISKNREVDYTPSGKPRVYYKHEDLAEIARTVTPILGKYGLSYRFRTSSNLNEPVSVTCIVSHEDGYSEENSLTGPRDEGAGKNSMQAIGSALTYLQRMTLKAALGLAAAADDDARSSEQPSGINDQQLDDLIALMDEVRADKPAFLKYFGVESLAQLPAKDYPRAVASLEKKRAR